MKKLFIILALFFLSGCAGVQQSEKVKAQFGTYYNAAITPANDDIILLADASNSNEVEGVHAEDLPIGTATQTALDGKVSNSDNEIVSGVKSFSSFPYGPYLEPITDYQLANKKYVDDHSGAGGDQLVDGVCTTPLLINGGTNVDDILPGTDGDITISMPAATNSSAGHMTAEQVLALEAALTVSGTPAANELVGRNAANDGLEYKNSIDVTMGGFTEDRAVYSDASGNLESSDVTKPEIELLNGMTSLGDGSREAAWTVVDDDVDTAVANGKQAFVVPASWADAGLVLTDVICRVRDLNGAISGATTVVIRRVRGNTSVDMTSAGVTINNDEYFAADEVVDTSNDDVIAGDALYYNITGVTSPAQKGLTITAVFTKP